MQTKQRTKVEAPDYTRGSVKKQLMETQMWGEGSDNEEEDIKRVGAGTIMVRGNQASYDLHVERDKTDELTSENRRLKKQVEAETQRASEYEQKMQEADQRERQAYKKVEEMSKLLKKVQVDGKIDQREVLLLHLEMQKKQWEADTRDKLHAQQKRIEEA